MAKRKATLIQEYIEAREDILVLRRQKEEDPTLTKSLVWLRVWNDAVAKAGELQRQLNGGDIGRVERQFRERGLVK